MAKKKKKTPVTRLPVKNEINTKALYMKRFAKIKQILTAYGMDPALLDEFSRPQQFHMLHATVEQPRFRIEEGNRVPGRIIDFISKMTHRILRNSYFGDPALGVTYLDLVIHGTAFTIGFRNEAMNPKLTPRQREIIDMLEERFQKETFISYEFIAVLEGIREVAIMVSKPSFRIYGFRWKFDSTVEEVWQRVTTSIYICSEEAESIRFVHKHKERSAFRVKLGRADKFPARKATISRKLATGEEKTPGELLDVYVQSHALQRASERLDGFPAHVRNFYVIESIAQLQRKCQTGTMLECYVPMGEGGILLGYFPYIVQEEKLIVITFLPYFSYGTPEGEILQRELDLQVEDMKFLGMDKQSFYLTVDLKQIPALYKVIEQTPIPQMIDFVKERTTREIPIDANRTRIVKRFFEQRTIHGLLEISD
jgi:hypothetical protein